MLVTVSTLILYLNSQQNFVNFKTDVHLTPDGVINRSSVGTPIGNSPTTTPSRFTNPAVTASFAPPNSQMYSLPQPPMEAYG